MRPLLTLACIFLASPVLAKDFTLDSPVGSAIIFNQGASVTRTAETTLPVGRHRLTLMIREELPDIRFEGSGEIALIARETQEPLTLPAPKTAAVRNLEAAFDTARAALAQSREAMDKVRARQATARMRLDFLQMLVSDTSGKPIDPEAMQGIVTLVDSQAEAAFAVVSKAKTDLLTLERRHQELKDALARARDALERGTPPEVTYTPLVLDVNVSVPFKGRVLINGLQRGNVGWHPVYEVNLVQNGNKGTLELHRKAAVSNYGEEGWLDVALTLSTASVNSATRTQEPKPQLRGLRDPAQNLRKTASAPYSRAESVPAVAPAVMAEAVGDAFGGTELRGQTVVFRLGSGNDLSWNTENKLFDLDRISIPVDLYAMANAAADDVAYLYTDLTNETGGILLAGNGRLYRDGALVGDMNIPLIYPGAEANLGLGTLLGLQIEHNILNAKEGESGFISSSTETSREVQTLVTSRLDYPITLKLLDVLPTSENEGLVITMRASPKPVDKNRNGKRGVLEWQLDMQPGTKHTVSFSYKMQWPKDKELTFR